MAGIRAINWDIFCSSAHLNDAPRFGFPNNLCCAVASGIASATLLLRIKSHKYLLAYLAKYN